MICTQENEEESGLPPLLRPPDSVALLPQEKEPLLLTHYCFDPKADKAALERLALYYELVAAEKPYHEKMYAGLANKEEKEERSKGRAPRRARMQMEYWDTAMEMAIECREEAARRRTLYEH